MLTLALDTTTLPHLAVHARGLLRLRIENRGAHEAGAVALHVTLGGAALDIPEAPALAAGAAAVVAVAVVPALAGYHTLAGELRLATGARFTFDGVHLLVGGDGAHVNVVHIDQSSARVVDNSKATFAAADAGGLLGDASWQPIALAHIAPVATPAPAPLPRVDFAITTALGVYRARDTLAHGDIATVYGGTATTGAPDVAIKLADQASDNDLMQHEGRVLGLLLARPDKTSIHFAAARDQFRTGDGRMGTVFDRLDGITLVELRDRFRARGEAGVPARHVVWILRRALAALGWAHGQGILHGNLDPSHVLVRGRDHMLWLVDWCWAVVNPAQTGQGFKAHNETYSPPEVAARGAPTPASDLYALGKCAIFVAGGDPATRTVPDAIDARLARFLRYLCVESQGGRGQDAWELYLQIDRIREQIWGPHEFVPLEI